MIEKLKAKTIEKDGGAFGIIIEKRLATEEEMQDEINELVDAINELQAITSKMENVEPSENVQPVAESRSENVHAVCPAVKYMGKVCRFWNGGNGKKFKNIGVLIEILSADNKRRYTCASKPKKHFEFCEPVKPDDDIIFKGE